MDDDFVCFKVDMKNAFNLDSRQTILEECANFYPELLPWVSCYYGSHPPLWHVPSSVMAPSLKNYFRMWSAAG